MPVRTRKNALDRGELGSEIKGHHEVLVGQSGVGVVGALKGGASSTVSVIACAFETQLRHSASRRPRRGLREEPPVVRQIRRRGSTRG